ncbi:MAG: hypothetical protein ACRDYV_10815, partial [Acidimicrobiia bacterium]
MPTTPAGQAAGWLLAHVAEVGQDLTAEEVQERWPVAGPPGADGLGVRRAECQMVLGRHGGHVGLDHIASSSLFEVVLIVLDARDRPWEWIVRVVDEPPHAIVG